MFTEITILKSGVIVSEASSESVQWPKFWYIYICVYLYIYILVYIGIYILWGNKRNCLNEVVQYKTTYVELALAGPMLYYFLVIRYISYIHL